MVDRLRNAGVLPVPTVTRVDFDHMFSRFAVDFRVSGNGALQVLTPMLVPTIEPLPGKRVHAALASSPAEAMVTWRKEGAEEWLEGTPVELDLGRPGGHDFRARVVHDGELYERIVRCYAAHDGLAARPLVVAPTLATASATGALSRVRMSTASDQTTWYVHRRGTESSEEGDFDLPPGHCPVTAVTGRPLTLRAYSGKLYKNETKFAGAGLTLRTNREFSNDGINTTANPNALTRHLFGPQGKGELGVTGRWMLDVLAKDNPELRRTSSGSPDLSAIQDVVLVMEYEVAT